MKTTSHIVVIETINVEKPHLGLCWALTKKPFKNGYQYVSKLNYYYKKINKE